MPSVRVISVVLLAGLGAVSAAVAGPSTTGTSQSDTSPTPSPTAAVTTPVTTPATPAATTPGTTPGTTNVAFDVRAENRRPGSKAWRVPAARESATGLSVAGGSGSVDAGAKVPLRITAAGIVSVTVLRIGWYSGAGARMVWQGDLTADLSGATIRTLDSSGWPPGQYLLRVDQGDATRTVPLTVRSPQLRGDVVLLASTLTWRMPGAPGFVAGEAGLVQQAERDGRRLAYVADVDVDSNPRLLDDAAAIVTGDSRQWSPQLRSAVRSAAASGTNLAFFAAGTGSRSPGSELQDGDGGRRHPGVRATAAERTALSRLSGQRPDCGRAETPATAWTVSEPAWWGYRDTGAYTGLRLPGLVDGGTDRLASGSTSGGTSSGPVQVLAATPFSCAGRTTQQAATYRVLPSGAAVFGTGTSAWTCTLNRTCAVPGGVSAQARAFAVRVTRNVLTGIARPVAGRRLAP